MTLRISGGRFGFFLVDLSTDAEKADSGLFLQIRVEDEEYLVLTSESLAHDHAAVVERFCARMRLPFETVYGPGKCRYIVGEPGWEIVGGGGWTRDPAGKWVELSGCSPTYGPFNPEGLQENMRAIPGWAHVDIRLGARSLN
ncbi:MAG TPA: hypothetical protein VIU29_03050 [Candidatus Deferrimicrobiaceae bacterium]